MNDSEILKNIEKLLSSIVILLTEQRSLASGDLEKKSMEKVEVILFRAGFKAPEIAKLTGKTLPAVQKTLQRAKK